VRSASASAEACSRTVSFCALRNFSVPASDQLVLDNDQYRRALGNRASQDVNLPSKPHR
jgi:hypothetical protein